MGRVVATEALAAHLGHRPGTCGGQSSAGCGGSCAVPGRAAPSVRPAAGQARCRPRPLLQLARRAPLPRSPRLGPRLLPSPRPHAPPPGRTRLSEGRRGPRPHRKPARRVSSARCERGPGSPHPRPGPSRTGRAVPFVLNFAKVHKEEREKPHGSMVGATAAPKSRLKDAVVGLLGHAFRTLLLHPGPNPGAWGLGLGDAPTPSPQKLWLWETRTPTPQRPCPVRSAQGPGPHPPASWERGSRPGFRAPSPGLRESQGSVPWAQPGVSGLLGRRCAQKARRGAHARTRAPRGSGTLG